MSRRTHRRLVVVTALFSLAIWLTLMLAEGYAPFHAWLHGGKIPDNDNCVVMMIHHGKAGASAATVRVSFIPSIVIHNVLTPVPVFKLVYYSWLPNRGPPPAFFS